MQDDATVLLTPEAFFGALLPEALRRQPPGPAAVLEISLFGPGPRTWTIDLGSGAVAPGPAQAPLLTLELDEGDFLALLCNRLDGDEAIAAGRVRYRGQLSLLERLAQALERCF